MKKILISLLLLGGCVTVQSPYKAPVYKPSVGQILVKSKSDSPLPVKTLFSVSELANAIVQDVIKNKIVSRYLKKNPKAWFAIRYNHMVVSTETKAICEINIPATMLQDDTTMEYGKEVKIKTKKTCISHPAGLRTALEAEFLNHGVERVVAGGFQSRSILSDERKFQMHHASARTIHSPGHVAGSSLLMTISIDSPRANYYLTQKETLLKIKVLRVKNDEVLFTRNYVLKMSNE